MEKQVGRVKEEKGRRKKIREKKRKREKIREEKRRRKKIQARKKVEKSRNTAFSQGVGVPQVKR
jgi:hypothetical protein